MLTPASLSLRAMFIWEPGGSTLSYFRKGYPQPDHCIFQKKSRYIITKTEQSGREYWAHEGYEGASCIRVPLFDGIATGATRAFGLHCKCTERIATSYCMRTHDPRLCIPHRPLVESQILCAKRQSSYLCASLLYGLLGWICKPSSPQKQASRCAERLANT